MRYVLAANDWTVTGWVSFLAIAIGLAIYGFVRFSKEKQS
jgi:hypothetical protein